MEVTTELRKLKNNRFIRSVAVVASGTASAQAITLGFAPLITRIYGPEAFGLLGTFMAVIAVLTPIAALAYPIAIVLPQEESGARRIVRLSALLAAGMAALVTALLIIAGDWFASLVALEQLGAFILLIPVAMLAAAFYQIFQQWAVRTHQYKIIAQAAVSHAVLLNTTKVGIGLLHPMGLTLVILSTLSQGLHALLLLPGFRSKKTDAASQQHTAQDLVQSAADYKDFPLYRAPHEFLNTTTKRLPIVFLAAMVSPASAGFFLLVGTALETPSRLLGTAVGNVFYPKITDVINEGRRSTALIAKATAGMAVIGLIPFGIVVAIGPALFETVFGSEWHEAGAYAQWMALWLFAGFINRPAMVSIPPLNLQRFLLFFGMSAAIIRLGGLLAGLMIFDDALIAVALFSLAGCVANLLLISVVLRQSRYQKPRT